MTNPPQIIRHKRSPQTANPSQAIAAAADPTLVASASAYSAKPESVTLTEADPVVSASPATGNPTLYKGSHAIDEIRDDLRLERFQTFDDEQGRSSEPEREGFDHNFKG